MSQQVFTLTVSESLGSVSAEVITGEHVDAIMTFAHGAGAGMNHSFMTQLANALAQVGVATLRFNFPYMEQQKRRPDVPAVAHKTIEAAIHEAHVRFPSIPLFASGKSFGGRMSSQYISNCAIENVKGIVFFGFPLHPAGKPSVDRAEHLKNVTVPMLFLQGTRDELATWDLITNVTDELPQATLFKVEGADHSFKAGKQDVIPVLARTTKAWINGVTGK